MSFSFTVRGASKKAALAAVADELAKIVKAQPAHKHDADTVQAVADLQVTLVPDPSKKQDILISVSGGLEWHGTEREPEFVGASVCAVVRLTAKE